MAEDTALEDAPDAQPRSVPIDVGQARFFNPYAHGLAPERIRPIIFWQNLRTRPNASRKKAQNEMPKTFNRLWKGNTMKRSIWQWIDVGAYSLLLIGALNWGLVGWISVDLVSKIFGSGILGRAVYILVGVSGLYILFFHMPNSFFHGIRITFRFFRNKNH